MANASAEKLKALGLRHGEKVVMALTATLCLFLLFSAVSKPTIDTTPEQVRKAAESADSNLKNRQNPEDILKKLEESGIKNPNFEKMVDAQSKDKLDPTAYAVRSSWITTEPGGGLIRDTPVLIAPEDLYAYPGRGSSLVFALDNNGERIPDDTKDATDVPKNSRRRKKRRTRAVGGMAGGMMGGQRRTKPKAKKNAAQIAEEEKKKYELEKKKKAGLFTNNDKEEAAPPVEEETTKDDGPFKEVTKGLRWVAITGVLDYKKLRDNYLQALKVSQVAYPHFKQLDVQRQVLQSDGEWTDWEDVDLEKNWSIVNNLPEEEEEMAPDSVLLEALVDPLPFLKSGYWERVHVGSLVPKEKKEVPKPAALAGNAGAMGGGDMGSMMRAMTAQQQEMQGGGNMAAMQQQRMASMMGSMGGMGEGMPGYGGGGTETINYEKTDADKVMIRSLDFTVDPDKTYRFRLRIVVFNPNRNHEDVSPGVDTKSPELYGPWSEPTNDVTMPADVAAYALRNVRDTATQNDQVQFQVARWNPDDGITVVKTFDAGPGDVLGEQSRVYVPTSDGSEKKAKAVDFNSHNVVLDTGGGSLALPRDLGTPGRLDAPAFSLLMRPDGTVIARTEANDSQDEVRKTMEANYKRELEESGKKRESSYGSNYGSMMQSMMMGGRR